MGDIAGKMKAKLATEDDPEPEIKIKDVEKEIVDMIHSRKA